MFNSIRSRKYLPPIFSLLLIFSCTSCDCTNSTVRNGEKLIKLIEDYREKNDSLPSSLLDINTDGWIEGVLYCYQKEDSLNYIIWYGTVLGEGVYYYSATKEWIDSCKPRRHTSK